jgi:hypothetical protein
MKEDLESTFIVLAFIALAIIAIAVIKEVWNKPIPLQGMSYEETMK